MIFASVRRILVALSMLIMAQHAALASEANADYVLSPGDVLSVKDKDGTVTNAPVLPDGTAVANYAGTIEAAGKTIFQVNQLVNEAGKKWFASPQIEVSLGRKRLEQVYVLGAVAHPGLYSAKEQSAEQPDTSLKSSKFTISTALENAGGLKENADIRHIHVTRLHPKMVIDVDLWKLMKDGDVTEDLLLNPGDVIYVPAAGTESGINTTSGLVLPGHKRIRVMGAVTKPGLIDISGKDIDLRTVIARAGGFRESNPVHTILVARTASNGSVTINRVYLNRKQKYPLELGDIVIVKSQSHTKNGQLLRLGGYGVAFSKYLPPSQSQIDERSKHSTADINSLWQAAQHLHHGATTKSQIETTYTEFESALQRAADELDTGEPPKADWAVELIANYTKPHHKWPAVSPTLDKVLQARDKLVQFTSEQAVSNVDQKLYRLATPEDKSRYYSSPDLRPGFPLKNFR